MVDRSFARPRRLSESPVGSHRRRNVALLAAVATVFVCGEAFVAAGATTAAVPSPPASVTATQAGPAPDLNVTWAPSSSGSPATGAVVQLYNMTTNAYETKEVCSAGCTSAVFRELQPGDAYGVLVWPRNATGTGQSGASNTVTISNPCGQGACVTVNANQVLHPADHAASGLLHSLYPVGSEPAALGILSPTMWRSHPTYNADGTLNWTSWDVAQSQGIPTTLVLSDMWWGHTSGGQRTPWSNWSAYTSWVTTTVKQVVASGRTVNYWEVYNEPGSDGYYPPTLFGSVNPTVLLKQFLVTYQAIRAVIPDAQIIGPSLEHWVDAPQAPTSGFRGFDMNTFLNFAATNNLQLAAVSWHFINDNLGVYPAENTLSPQNVVDEVADARRLIAALPALGQPKIFVNEYGMPEVSSIPGWDVQYLAALTDAGVASGGMSCWGNTCSSPDLDGLLSGDGSSTMPDFWVHDAYAQLTGSMVSTASTDDNVAAVASFDSATSTLSALVGRGQGCTENAWCSATWPWMKPAGAEPVTITLNVPWSTGTATVSETHIPNSTSSPAGPPATQTGTVAITPTASGGTITVPIPSFADGDAYCLVITQAA